MRYLLCTLIVVFGLHVAATQASAQKGCTPEPPEGVRPEVWQKILELQMENDQPAHDDDNSFQEMLSQLIVIAAGCEPPKAIFDFNKQLANIPRKNGLISKHGYKWQMRVFLMTANKQRKEYQALRDASAKQAQEIALLREQNSILAARLSAIEESIKNRTGTK